MESLPSNTEDTGSMHIANMLNTQVKTIMMSNYNSMIAPNALRTISIAPMMEITDIHYRFLMRLITKHTVLWTEMIHENAILNSKIGHKQILKFNNIEHPIVIQLGGNTPESLAKCAKLCEEMGYDEINLNCGCPSPRVQDGAFGACLMKEPELVAECMNAMQKVVQIPISIKMRIGVDEYDTYEFTKKFIDVTSEKGKVKHYIMHARKAFLKGLSPVENRNIPPLDYPRVLELKKDFPHLDFTINGGFKCFDDVKKILAPENNLVGCMIGRMAQDNPWAFSDVDRLFYGQKNLGFSRKDILERWAEYGEIQLEEYPGMSVVNLTRPIINLFAQEKHSIKYRRYLSNPENFKNNGKSFRDLIYSSIHLLEKFNPEALNAIPCMDDPKLSIA